jgi:putative redox protein
MTTEISIHAVHEGGMRVTAGDNKHQVTMDYPMHPGDVSAGLTPLKTLLVSLAACSLSTLSLVLTKMKQPVDGLEVEAHALRRQKHPTVLTGISLAFTVTGSAVDRLAVERAIKIAESELCPVWNMLKSSTPIHATFQLVEKPIVPIAKS